MFDKLRDAFSSKAQLVNQLLSPEALMWKALRPKKMDGALLLEALSKGANVNHPNRKGLTPLMACIQATSTARYDWIEVLLQKGADANAMYQGRGTLSHLLESGGWERSKGVMDTFDLLVQHGADPTVGGLVGNALSDTVMLGGRMMIVSGPTEQRVHLRVRFPYSCLKLSEKELKPENRQVDTPIVSIASWEPALVSKLVRLGVKPMETPVFFQAVTDKKKLVRVPVKDHYAQGLMAVALMSSGLYGYRVDIERAFSKCDDLVGKSTLAEWMIQTKSAEAFGVALSWMTLTNDICVELQKKIDSQFSRPGEALKGEFQAYLEQEQLRQRLEVATPSSNTSRPNQPRL